jgi:hypothetical protein
LASDTATGGIGYAASVCDGSYGGDGRPDADPDPTGFRQRRGRRRRRRDGRRHVDVTRVDVARVNVWGVDVSGVQQRRDAARLQQPRPADRLARRLDAARLEPWPEDRLAWSEDAAGPLAAREFDDDYDDADEFAAAFALAEAQDRLRPL